MTKEQVKEIFREEHGKAVSSVADAQYWVMEAQANLAAARVRQRELEKRFRENMASAGAAPEPELPFPDGKKK